MNEHATTKQKRILVFRTGHLGDTLVALPAFWAIRNRYPNAHITCLSNANSENPHYVSMRKVLPEEGLFDSWITYPNGLNKIRSFIGFWRLARTIRSGRYDALIYLMTRGRSRRQIDRDTRFFRFTGVPKIFCIDYARANLLETKVPAKGTLIESEGDFLLNCLRSEDVLGETETPVSDMRLTDDEVSAADEWLRSVRNEADSEKPMIAVAPGSKWESKIWPEERFAAVIEKLMTHFRAFPIIFGGPEDREKGDRLLRFWNTGANAAGVLNVRKAAAALRRCHFYLGNDTGTMHLAAAAGIPCIAIFAAVDWPGRWYPHGEGHRIFRRSVECEVCHVPVSFNGNKCLDLIGIDEVYDACAEVLENEMSSARL